MGNRIKEIRGEGILLANVEDALDLIGNSDSGFIAIRRENIIPEFFVLRSGIAGEILQKFSTYDFHMAIIGDFSDVGPGSLHDFICESNRTGRIIFVSSPGEARVRFAVENNR